MSSGNDQREDLPSWESYDDDDNDNDNDNNNNNRRGGRTKRSGHRPLSVTDGNNNNNNDNDVTTSGTNNSDEQDLPRIILMTRLANLGISVLLILVSIGNILGFPTLSTWVLSCYALCGACLICMLETQLKFLRVAIALNFGFLFSNPLRFMFYMLLTTLSWSAFGFFGRLVSLGIFAVAIFNAYVLWRYPSYRRIRDEIALEEDRLIEAKVSREIKQQAVGSLMTSASAAASSAFAVVTGSGNNTQENDNNNNNDSSSTTGGGKNKKKQKNKKNSTETSQGLLGGAMSGGSFS